MEKEVIRILKKYKGKFSSASDVYFHPNIPDKRLKKAIKKHDLGYDETILFLSANSLFGLFVDTCIITKNYFSFKCSDSDQHLNVPWSEFYAVRFFGDKFHFLLDPDDPEKKRSFGKNDVFPTLVVEGDLGEVFADLLTEISGLYENKAQNKFKELNKIFASGDPAIFENTSAAYLREYGEEGEYSNEVHFLRSRFYLNKGDLDKASEEIKYCEQHLEDGICAADDFANDIYETKADICLKVNEEYKALSFYSKALTENPEKGRIHSLRAKQRNANLLLQKNFLEKSYQERKLILVDESQADFSSKDFKVLLKEILPDIRFPVGHPVNKELYVGHPYDPAIYVPLSGFEENLFMDRFQEFSYFLQSLGATKISIENKRGRETEEVGGISAETDVNIDTLIMESNTKNSLSATANNNDQSFKRISRNQTFSPTKKPFLPENLRWYPNETSWQRLYEQRINGNLLNHSEIISTEQNQVITRNEKRSIQQSLQYYMIEADATHTVDTNSMFREKETTEWIIHVEFAPIETLTGKEQLASGGQSNENKLEVENSTTNNKIFPESSEKINEDVSFQEELSAPEKKYTKRVQLLTEDTGEITEEDRSILDRISIKLKITKERALQLEEQVLGVPESFTDEELQYIEELEFCIEDDGVISEKERQLLEQERKELGIDFERARELEQGLSKKQETI